MDPPHGIHYSLGTIQFKKQQMLMDISMFHIRHCTKYYRECKTKRHKSCPEGVKTKATIIL